MTTAGAGHRVGGTAGLVPCITVGCPTCCCACEAAACKPLLLSRSEDPCMCKPAGYLPHPQVAVAVMGIAFNTHAWCFMFCNGVGAAVGTRVANELGAQNPAAAQLAAQASVPQLAALPGCVSGGLTAC